MAVRGQQWIFQLYDDMKISWCALTCVFLFGCGGDPYSGFGRTCTEGHPAVDLARSLSQEQLEFLYEEMTRLRDSHPDSDIKYSASGDTIPESLMFLNAYRVQPSEGQITLDDCFDEYIILSFTNPDGDPTITLTWAAPTTENPYITADQVLWSAGQ